MTAGTSAAEVLARLAALRADDAPTHGGRVLSYVYDAGRPELDELAAAAMRQVQAINGLDPTAFPSVARLEADLVAFARTVLHGDGDGDGDGSGTAVVDTAVVGTVTTGGTESCLLAVKAARDLWRAAGGQGRARLVAPVTAHAAFQKAAHYFDLELDLVPVDPATGAVVAERLMERLDGDVALVVVSAPSYPHAALDPIAEVAAAAAARGIACHVDACIGGFALPWWPGVPAWDFRVAGVTSISADLHKFGYAPKGASVLLHRGPVRRAAQYFATTRWPGYPVVNPTMLGSRSAGPLAAAWAIVQALGTEGYGALMERARAATEALHATIHAIPGLRVFGEPIGPLLAVVADESDPENRVDPHHWADAVRRRGWVLQQQPGMVQSDGTRLPRSTHLTVTPVTADSVDALGAVLRAAADEVRGIPSVDTDALLGSLPPALLAAAAGGAAGDAPGGVPPEALGALLGLAGIGTDGSLPAEAATLTALIEALPPQLVEPALIALLGSLVDPRP
jgi:glutamate/tyrosine decarboxylase-like PLP-dependent enzyme